MAVRFAVTGIVCLAIMCGFGCEDVVTEDQTVPLAGTWAGELDTVRCIVQFHDYGFDFTTTRLTGDTLIDRNGTLVVDSTVSPHRVTFSVLRDRQNGYRTVYWNGIYRRTGDTLELAVPDSLGDIQRPVEFTNSFDWFSTYALVLQP